MLPVKTNGSEDTFSVASQVLRGVVLCDCLLVVMIFTKKPKI